MNEELDRAGRLITRASVLSDDEAAAVAANPYVITRLRARIRSEQELAETGLWMSLWASARRAIPAMIIVAALSFGLSLYTGGNKSTTSAFSVDAYLGTNEAGIENMVFAERRPLTSEEVLATIISKDEREAR